MAKNTKKNKQAKDISNKLEKEGAKYDILEHKTAYTAIDAANTLKKGMDKIAKSLLVKAGSKYYIVCLPADHNLDFDKLKETINKETGQKVKEVKIPGEKAVKKFIKSQKSGLPAFGSLHKIPVILDKKLSKAKKAVFPSGSLNHSVEMAVRDFIKLENAVLGRFGIKKKVKMVSPSKKASSKKKSSKKGSSSAGKTKSGKKTAGRKSSSGSKGATSKSKSSSSKKAAKSKNRAVRKTYSGKKK